ncbi:unnamed protein product [Effrenium voratum]|uniref:Thioredoxin domain-containing protein n=1 Tax=Effrenium voratum TaxID=2562239 RepID=A0AA36HYN4_9DINO|nr:unnamed protein product [Effrenium voratum]
MLFPDTRVLLPGLQAIFTGQMQHTSLLQFTVGPWPPLVQSREQLQEAVQESGRQGTFVGLFRSSDMAGPLQELWPLDCLKRHKRAYAFARWGNESSENTSKSEEDLWRWAGLGFSKALRIREVQEGQMLKQEVEVSEEDFQPEEAIVYVRADDDACEFAPSGGFVVYQEGGSLPSKPWPSWTWRPGTWRDQVEAFCAWCERQVLAPATVFDAPRAAALDGTFDWLLFLFAPKVTEDQNLAEGFDRELRRLERFARAACAKDKRYQEVLPVIVPAGGEDIAAFRASFGLGSFEPTLPLPREGDSQSGCRALEDTEEASRRVLFATSLFNTRTRRKYPAPGGAGWCPGDELALCLFTDAVLDGRVSPYVRSTKRPELASPGVKELCGSSVDLELLQPVKANESEVLLLLYAPFCSHSLHFFWLWNQLSAAIQAATGPRNGTVKDLQLAQMDAMQNEHPDLPPTRQFPTLVFCRAKKDTGESGAAVEFLTYEGPATLSAILAWLGEYSAFAPPNLQAATQAAEG